MAEATSTPKGRRSVRFQALCREADRRGWLVELGHADVEGQGRAWLLRVIDDNRSVLTAAFSPTLARVLPSLADEAKAMIESGSWSAED